MTEFEKIYLKLVDDANGHILIKQYLAKVSVLAGFVYEPEIDTSMDEELKKLSNQIYNLELLDELKSFIIQSSIRDRNGGQTNTPNYEDIFKRATELTNTEIEHSANYAKILGWAKQKAIKMNQSRE